MFTKLKNPFKLTLKKIKITNKQSVKILNSYNLLSYNKNLILKKNSSALNQTCFYTKQAHMSLVEILNTPPLHSTIFQIITSGKIPDLAAGRFFVEVSADHVHFPVPTASWIWRPTWGIPRERRTSCASFRKQERACCDRQRCRFRWRYTAKYFFERQHVQIL